MPSSSPAGTADFEALLAAVKAAVAEAANVPQLLDGVKAREYVGLSRTGWFRAASAGSLPKPVFVPGSGDRWRKADLDAYIERLRPRRRKAPPT